MTQNEALAVLKTGANVFLTGEPGSGKTHTVNQYVSYLHSCGIEPAITASTGIAATHIGGMTIHSWSGIGVKNFITDADLDAMAQKERLALRLQNARVLIIDEISMLSAETLASVEKVCRALRARPDESFGGLQIVLVGDFFQLPPIARDTRPSHNDNQAFFPDDDGEPRSLFAFTSRVWKELNPLVCYLSEQHRHEDAEFLRTLTAIRRGAVTENVRARLSERANTRPASGESFTKLFPHNADVDSRNLAELGRISGESRTFRMEAHGAPPLIEGLKRSCLSPETLTLKIGARVMFTKNDLDRRFVNGTLGEIVGFSDFTGQPIVAMRSGRKIEVEPLEWTIQDGTKILAKIIQVPLRLAWAITVHKSQGMSLDAAEMDLRTAFEYGQGYVALSRLRSFAGLYLLGFNDRALEVHPEVMAVDEKFRKRSEETRGAFRAMEDRELFKMHENFVRAAGGRVGAGRKEGKSGKSKTHGSTYATTQELVFKKLSLEQIAKERGVKVDTIMHHLEKLSAEKKISPSRDLAHMKPPPVRFEKIRRAFEVVQKKEGEMLLAPTHDLLGSDFDFPEMRLVRLFL